MSESIKYVSNEQLRAARKRKGTPRRSGIQEENMFQSSAIVYTVSEVTPFTERYVSLLFVASIKVIKIETPKIARPVNVRR